MLFFAVFAPLIANTHPLLMLKNGHWSSPLLLRLHEADVVLLIMFFAGATLLLISKISVVKRSLIFLGISVAAIFLAIAFVRPPATEVLDEYRTGLSNGTITRAIYVPIHFSPDDRQRDAEDVRNKRPSIEHPLGTTDDSADLAANLIYASRIALSIGFVATGVAIFFGILMGGVMGYFGGMIDLVGMRIVEIFESIPRLLLLLSFVNVFQQHPNIALYVMMAVIGFLDSFSYAEFVRAEFLSLRDREFVHAANAAGLPLYSILFRHMLPNGLTPVIVNASFGVASAILTESTLSFLGIGLQTEASWGNLLDQARGEGGNFFWWLALFPGLAIFLSVLAYNLIGESLRDALDPRLNKMA